MKTKTIFRVWKSRTGTGVIALFPEMVSDSNVFHCESFEHVGQHGAADPRFVMRASRPATRKEYADLRKELEGRGYSVQVIQRLHRSYFVTRWNELQTMDKAVLNLAKQGNK
jgi:hypothetical protein